MTQADIDEIDPVVGNYKVSFAFLDDDGSENTTYINVPIGNNVSQAEFVQRDANGEVIAKETKLIGPWVDNRHPYEGPLRKSELAWVKSIPGKLYNTHFRFVVEGL